MTVVTALFLRPTAAGPVPAVGDVTFLPTRRRTAGGESLGTILPAPFVAAANSQGVATFALEPTTVYWVWKAVERFSGLPPVVRYINVPDNPEGEDYVALAEVDPATLLSPSAPDPAWYAYTDLLKAEATAAKTNAAASKVAAEAAQSAATTSQTSAAASAATATTKAGEASASASAAAGSATSASGSATSASGSATSASGSATSATGSAATATTKAAEASASASAAAVSKTGADAARDIAVAHATGFSAGTVTSLSHLAAPTAAVTGTAPALKLDLGIPRGVPTAITIGEVETGPETPGIVGPTGPTGPQGNPGGIVTGTLLNASDLNTITASGVYRQDNGTNITLAKNYPENSGETGVLIVHQSSGTSFIEQQWFPSDAIRNSRVFWTRSYNYGTWRAWRAYASTRVDQTAGRAIYQWDELNDREQIIYGDTGWRDIALDSTYGIVAAGDYFGRPSGNGAIAAGDIRLRRINNTVYIGSTIALQPKQDYTTTTRNLCILPPGFRSSGNNEHLMCRYGNNGGDSNQKIVNVSPGAFFASPAYVVAVPILTSNWNGDATGGTYPKLYHGIWLYGSWPTNDAWPTTLPGNANGSIPNL